MKRERIYVENRRKQILEILKYNPEVRVDELAKKLEVSLITIRRDLQYLEDKNYLKRFYGGAKSTKQPETTMDAESLYRDLIARYAARFVSDEDSLFINTSRTALAILPYISCNNVTVITNNGRAIACEYDENVSVILTGGELRHPKEAMVGDFALRNLQTVFANKAFIGCSGIAPLTGMTTENANEVKSNELMIQNAIEDVYLLADHTKVGKNSCFTSAPIEKITHLITDELASKEVLDRIRERGVKVHQVSRDDFDLDMNYIKG